MPGERERQGEAHKPPNATHDLSRRDVLKTSGLVPLVPVSGARWTDLSSATGLAGAGTGQLAIDGAEDVVFSDDFSTNTLSEYAISQDGSNAGAGSVTWNAAGEQLLIRTGNNVTVLLSRDDVPFPASGSVRLRYVVHGDYHLTNDFAVRWQADDGDLLEWQVTGDAPDGSRFRDAYDDWVRVRRDGASEILDRTDGSVGPNSGERVVEATWTASSMSVSVDGSVEASADVDTTGIDPTTLTLSFNQGDVDLRSIVVTGSGGAGGDLVWDTAADWDDAVAESGVVHESVSNTDHVDAGVVKQGYSIASPVAGPSLVAYWPLQEDGGGTAFDLSGNGIDGAVSGATQGAPGLLGTTAYSFDGSSDIVSTTTTVPGVGRNTAFSAAAWFRPGSAHYGTIVNHKNGTDDRFSSTYQSDQTINCSVGSRTETEGELNAPATPGEWYHFVYTWDGSSTATLYVDGVDAGSSGAVTGSRREAGVYIGQKKNGELPFDGLIADVRFYDRTLSASEVQALYDVATMPGTLTTAAKQA